MKAYSDAHLNTIRRFWFILGCYLGVWFTVAVQHALKPEPPVIDERMEKACRWPRLEGETTIGLVIDGKLRCYVNR